MRKCGFSQAISQSRFYHFHLGEAVLSGITFVRIFKFGHIVSNTELVDNSF